MSVWRSFHVIGGTVDFRSTIEIAPSTGQTIEHKLQPTQSSSRTFSNGRPFSV